jgi:hypothetical protein
MSDTFRELLKRLMSAPDERPEPAEPDPDAETLPRELPPLEAGPARDADPAEGAESVRQPSDSSSPPRGDDSPSRAPFDLPSRDAPGTNPADPPGSDAAIGFLNHAAPFALAGSGPTVQPDEATDSLLSPEFLSASGLPGKGAMTGTDLPMPQASDGQFAGPAFASNSPSQVAESDPLAGSVPSISDSPSSFLAADGLPTGDQSLPARAGESDQSPRLESLLEALDRQMQSAGSGQSRVLERLDALLEQTRAAQAEQSRLQGRIDQLEAAHLLRGRL